MTTNLKWSMKKNISMQNSLLAFGVAGGLQSACTELQQAGKSDLHRILLCSQRAITKIGQPYTIRIHLIVGQPDFTLGLLCKDLAIIL